MDKIIEGLKVDSTADGTWLHFSSSKGRHCSVCLETKFPEVFAKTIKEWIQDRLKEQGALVKMLMKSKDKENIS